MNFDIKSSFSKRLNFCLLLNFNIIILLIGFSFNLITKFVKETLIILLFKILLFTILNLLLRNFSFEYFSSFFFNSNLIDNVNKISKTIKERKFNCKIF